ncbi:MAG: electron transport complex subunit E [Odoribacter sp.]|nr:electron transport complex subunit E [Odoribacter sp.]
MNALRIFLNGLIKQNPTFVLILGMCPTLGTTSSAITGLSMGVATMVVLACSNIVVSACRKLIPDAVRIPAFILIISTFVTVIQLIMQAWLPSLDATLGIFIPLIVVNCILLGRAESFASRNTVSDSLFDGLGIGAGFTCALTVIGTIRELLGTGSIFGIDIFPSEFGSLIFVLAPGAFIVLGLIIALFNRITH